MASVKKGGKVTQKKRGAQWLPVFNRIQLLGSRRQVMLLM